MEQPEQRFQSNHSFAIVTSFRRYYPGILSQSTDALLVLLFDIIYFKFIIEYFINVLISTIVILYMFTIVLLSSIILF